MEADLRGGLPRIMVYSHAWLALGAAAQTWWMGELMGGSGWRAPTLAFCGTVIGYAYMRWARMDHPELAGSAHLKWFRENKRTMLALAIFSAVVGTIVAWPIAGELASMFWPVAVIGALYVIPWSLSKGRTIGLRRIPMLKALLIAFVWASTTVGLPFVLVNTFEESAWWFFGQQFVFFLSLTIAFDLRDLPYDRPSLRTLPQLIGTGGSRFFAVIFQLPWVFFFVVSAIISLSPIEEGTPKGFLVFPMLLPALGHLAAAGLVVRAGPGRSEAYYSLGLDGMLILIPLLGWVGSYF